MSSCDTGVIIVHAEFISDTVANFGVEIEINVAQGEESLLRVNAEGSVHD